MVIFDPLKDQFAEAEDIYPDDHVDDKHKCRDNRDEIDDTIEQLIQGDDVHQNMRELFR